ncbi:hypothetical protein [Luteibacter sp. ME-Dv--P-043b]|jgi:hypothetical protein|uniref:hypothetical protein n=1 Tax=Lysobacterales TaxID=135614 RepID=UPI0025577D7E|nr:hypothetical protein [Luteibacter sp. ME-Dv--P-043b]
MAVDDTTRHEAQLDEQTRFALQQLCSTAYLAVSSLNESACVALLRRGLAVQDELGYWSVTPSGKKTFERLGKSVSVR